jgi:RNA polymerase sigma-70 factor, ECF subfamily
MGTSDEDAMTPTGCASDPLHGNGNLVLHLLSQGRAAWPGVDLPCEAFASHLRRCLPGGVDAESALQQMRTNDLYLACACARADPVAVAAFERHCLGVVDEALAAMRLGSSALVNEVKQRLRVHLLLADPGAPGILAFAGRGNLRHWLRVMAVREALALVRVRDRELPADDELLERAVLPAASPELEFLKKHYQHEFSVALAGAVSALSARDRTLLRQTFVDGLTIDHLGKFYGVHRATAARRLARAQRFLRKELEARLMQRLRIQRRELISILRLVRSGLEVSLRWLFPGSGRMARRSIARAPGPIEARGSGATRPA